MIPVFFTFRLAAHHCHEDVVGGRSYHCYPEGTTGAGSAVEGIWDSIFMDCNAYSVLPSV